MKWTESKGDGGFKTPEAGTYSATCYQLIDLGTQNEEYQGKAKMTRKVMIGWELSELMDDGRPYVMSKWLSVSLHPDSNLRKLLKGWRGRDFTDEELQGFDAKKLIGAPCMINCVMNKKGTKIVVETASKLPKGMEKHELVNPTVYFSLDEFDQKVFDGLSDGLKGIIQKSPEYAAATGNDSFSNDEDESDVF